MVSYVSEGQGWAGGFVLLQRLAVTLVVLAELGAADSSKLQR
jgi:hypothetical protein